jgi:hypothetical protein
MKGGAPASASKRIAPIAQMSARWSMSSSASDDGPRLRQARALTEARPRGLGLHQLRQPEVDDLHVQLVVVAEHEKQVLGLEVAVNDAGRVHLAQAAQGLDRKADGLTHLESAVLLDVGAEISALEQLHHQEGLPFAVLAPVEHLHDVGALHRRDGPCFAVEARERRFVGLGSHVQELQRHALA